MHAYLYCIMSTIYIFIETEFEGLDIDILFEL